MSPLTLAHFLLTRIADEEALARKADPRDWDLSEWASVDSAWFGAEWDPDRVLVECATKRRVVETCVEYDDFCAEAVLQVLALPYVDHPDYDEAWR